MANEAKVMYKEGGIVVNNPGQVIFIPQKEDGSDDWDNAITNVARIVSATVTNSRTKTDIQDGNSFYKAGDRVTAIAGTVAVEFSTIDPIIWGMITGEGYKVQSTDVMRMINKEYKIMDNKITIDKKRVADGAVKIMGYDGTQFVKSETESPTEGQFYIDPVATGTTTVIEFNVADNEKPIRVTMEYEANTFGYSIDRKTMPNHKMIVNYQTTDLAGKLEYENNIIVSQVSIGADIAENLQKDPSQTKTLTFDMYAPKAGEKPYELKTELKTA